MAHTSFPIKIQVVRDRFASMVTMNGARGRLARLRANHATVNAYPTPPPRGLTLIMLSYYGGELPGVIGAIFCRSNLASTVPCSR